jgi:xanthine dehydrogenase YagT iron-sulfur-binding subunit
VGFGRGRAGYAQQMAEITMRVNGTDVPLTVDPRTSLLDLLRERLGLTGTKKGCDHGQCGACTVLIDGRRANACLALAIAQDGSDVTTVEGLAPAGQAADGDLHPLQAAFIEHDAFQCGYCTPGQLCSAVGMLAEGGPSAVTEDLGDDPALAPEEIRERMSGNLCRCGAYVNIVAAIADVAGFEAGEGEPAAVGEVAGADARAGARETAGHGAGAGMGAA